MKVTVVFDFTSRYVHLDRVKNAIVSILVLAGCPLVEWTEDKR